MYQSTYKPVDGCTIELELVRSNCSAFIDLCQCYLPQICVIKTENEYNRWPVLNPYEQMSLPKFLLKSIVSKIYLRNQK